MHKVELGRKTTWTREASTHEEGSGKLDKATFTTKQILGTHLNFHFAEDKNSSFRISETWLNLKIVIYVAFPSCRNTEISFLGHMLSFCSVVINYDHY